MVLLWIGTYMQVQQVMGTCCLGTDCNEEMREPIVLGRNFGTLFESWWPEEAFEG